MSDFNDLRILLRTHQQEELERILNSHRVQQFDEAAMDAFLKRDRNEEFATLSNRVSAMDLLRPSKSFYDQYFKEKSNPFWNMQRIHINPEDIIMDDVFISIADIEISVELVNDLKGMNELWTPRIANLRDFKNQSLIKEIRKPSFNRLNQNGAQIAKMFVDSMKGASASLVILSKNFKELTQSIRKAKSMPYKLKNLSIYR